LDFTLDKKTAY